MKTKLIKISESHYIIVDDSEMLPDVFIYDFLQKEIKRHSGTFGHLKYINDNCKKITHSTQPLERYYGATDGTIPFVYHKIKPLSLSEVEEVINGYSVEKMAEEFANNSATTNYEDGINVGKYQGYIAGVNTHKELVKDKLFTMDDLKTQLVQFVNDFTKFKYRGNYADIINQFCNNVEKSLLPKTEWECYFDEQGKLKLI
mgnify:CR=1 FL=1